MKKSAKRFNKNDIIPLTIDGITDLGFGVGRHEGMVVFVADTVPGDRCRVRIIKVNSSYLVGRLEELISPSDERTEGRCRSSLCKSCAYRGISYEREAKIKEEAVRHAFSTPALSSVQVGDIITSPAESRYRNKAQYPVACVGGHIVAGFYAPKSHRVTPVEDCPLAPEIFGRIVGRVLSFANENGYTAYNEGTGEGLLRHIYLRGGEIGGEVLLTLVVNGDRLPCEAQLVDTLCKEFPELVGILINENTESTNVVLGDKFRTIFGRDYIYDTLAGVRLKITAPSFYQVNRACAEILYAKARELAAPTKDDVLLDLYCGAGSIGLSMARDVRELIGIEIIDSAVRCAEENAEENGITNAKFYTGDAADTERLLENAERSLGRAIKPDIIVLDPPRGGCDERLLRFVASLSPKRIVYVSCNPKTLARDAEILLQLGFDCGTVTPVDMFPLTGHVESLVCLQRQTN